jgi:cytochrome c oxidase assembly protein subunit 17
MGAAESVVANKRVETKGAEPAEATAEKPKCKACCACPETKVVRDAWSVLRFEVLRLCFVIFNLIFISIVENGEENCTDLIEAHKACMRKMGFNI